MLSSIPIRRAARSGVRSLSATSRAASSVVCEGLESRKLLTTHHYEVPFEYSVAYIQQKDGGVEGQLQIRLGSLSNPPVTPNPFDNTTGMDLVTSARSRSKRGHQIEKGT
jgi:hypothetical protein